MREETFVAHFAVYAEDVEPPRSDGGRVVHGAPDAVVLLVRHHQHPGTLSILTVKSGQGPLGTKTPV